MTKIIYTSDVHGYLFPTDYLDRNIKKKGYISFIDQINSYRDENTILLDAGDILQGSSLAYYLEKENNPELMADILNEFKIDYYTLGNHDFNYGYAYLKKFVDRRNSTLICANVKDKNKEIKTNDYIIKKLNNGKTLGIIGVVTDWIKLWERKENIENFIITKPLDAISDNFKYIKDCDYKICLYHGGYDIDLETLEKNTKTDENVGGEILKNFNFDLLLTGHQHMPFEGKKIYNTYTSQAPANGEGFVLVDLDNKSSKIIKGEKINTNIYNKYKYIDDKVQDFLDNKLCKLKRPYPDEDKIQRAKHGSILADFFNKIIIDYSKADISITSFANEISGLSENVSIREILNTYRFPNTLIVLEISAEKLKKALEQNFTYLKNENTINKNFLIPKEEHYNFDFFYGIDFDVDFTKDFYERISNITFKGKPVKDGDKFKIAMNNYRATGAGNFDMYKDLKVVKSFDKEISEILIDAFRSGRASELEK